MTDRRAPVVPRLRIGLLLRQLRDATGVTGEELATAVSMRPPKIYRIEGGKVAPTGPELQLLLNYFHADEAQVEYAFNMLERTRGKPWYHAYDAVFPQKFETYVGLETDATSLRAYETHVIHGLLQTEDHARALMLATNHTMHAEDVEQLIELRMHRTSVLRREPEPLHLWAVLEESTLRRIVGGPSVHRDQLQHLLDINDKLPNVNIQVIPTSAGAHAGLNGSFSIIELADDSSAEELTLAYTEGQFGNVYLEKPADIRRCKLSYNALLRECLPKDQSADLIKSIKETL